jgi:hypothetical protein
MIVLSHRGYWHSPAEKNTTTAFERSFDLGFGLETDVRDHCGELVISHDMPAGGELSLSSFLTLLRQRPLPLAMNIKADGLAAELTAVMYAHGVHDWFVFDMAVPDMRGYQQAGVPVFTRMSEVERQPVWMEQAAGIWLDSFGPTWYDAAEINALLGTGKRVCVVSSELHGRGHRALWEMLRPFTRHPQLMLCTDLPEAARDFFR